MSVDGILHIFEIFCGIKFGCFYMKQSYEAYSLKTDLSEQALIGHVYRSSIYVENTDLNVGTGGNEFRP